MPAEVVRFHGRQPGQARLLLKDEATAKIRAHLLQSDSAATHSERALQRSSASGSVRFARPWSGCVRTV